MTDPLDLRERYRRALEAQQLRGDADQQAAVAKLEGLRRRLASLRAPRGPRWLRTLATRAEPPERGLYLWGDVGRGKTWLMDLFAASLAAGLARRLHFHRFMQEVHGRLAQLQRQRAPLERLARAMALEARVLCFDELYVSDIADAMILGGLFAGLFRHGVTLVATSNVPPQELYREGLQRQRFLPAIALLEQHLQVVHLAGDTDYRLRRLTQAGVYLPAEDRDTPARLERLFGQLAGPDAARGGALDIQGRPVRVLGASAAVAWFDFTALCGAVRSQNDYIEIAREYHTVFVSGVPLFDSAQDDEARRFIALVDELYDHNVNLVLSAAAAPGQLYRGERLSGLFARTASRLAEMQSTEYLGRAHRP